MSTSRAISFNGAQGVLGYVGAGVLSGATLTSPTLNLDVDTIYEFEGSFKQGATADLRFFLNSDTTAGNYDRSNNAGASANNSLIFISGSSGVSGSVARFSGKIFKDIDGRPTVILTMALLSTTSMVSTIETIVWRTANTNVTSFQFNQSSGSLTSGSMVVFRKSPGVALSGFGYAEGAAFPASPITGQKFYHTGANHLCYYDGTRWLTEQEFSENFGGQDVLQGTNTTPAVMARGLIPTDYSIYLTKIYCNTFTAATNNGSNFYTYTFTGLGGVTFTTAADTAAVFTNHSNLAVNTVVSAGGNWQLDRAKTSTPGIGYIVGHATYRLIIT